MRTDQPRAAGSEEHRQRSTTRPATRAGSHTGGEYKEDPKQGSADGRGSDNSPDRLPTLSAWQTPKGEVSPLSAWQSPKGPSHYPVHGRGSDNSPDRLSPLCLGRSAIPPSIPPVGLAIPEGTFPLSLGRSAIPPPVSVRPSPPTGTFPCPPSHQAPPAAVAARRIPWRLTPLDRPPRPPPSTRKPWPRDEPPCDPRGHTPPPPPDPTTWGTRWDPCPEKDESIEALLAQLRLPPLLSPIKDPAPKPRRKR